MSTAESTRIAVRMDESQPLVGRTNPARSVWVILAGLVLLGALVLLSLMVGSGDMSWSQAWQSLTNPGDSTDDVIVQTLRIPRTELGVLVGAALGLAGVLIQAVTRNPLADPGILGRERRGLPRGVRGCGVLRGHRHGRPGVVVHGRRHDRRRPPSTWWERPAARARPRPPWS